jgi:hypothetical protein
MQHIFGRHAWIGEIDTFDMFRQYRLQHAAQHGFAAAYFPHHLDNAFAIGDGIH